MEMNLEVLRSLAIQRRKPWPCFAWLRESHIITNVSKGLFLLDKTRISQLFLSTGKTRRNFPSLSSVQLALTSASSTGAVLSGLTVQGHMFTWSQPSHDLCVYTTPLSQPAPHQNDLKGCCLFMSDSGEQALLVTGKLDLYIWELRDGQCSDWWKLPVPDDIHLPLTDNRTTIIDANFYVHQVLGECCECNIVYTNHDTDETMIANCLLRWKQRDSMSKNDLDTSSNLPTQKKVNDGSERARSPLSDTTNVTNPTTSSTATQPTKPVTRRSIPVYIDWKTCTASKATTHHHAPSGRGCYVTKLSPTGRLTAVAINHDNAADISILFLDVMNEVSILRHVYTHITKKMNGRTYWITSLAWSGDGLLLAAMTHRGCLVVIPRFGHPLRLITTGCNVDMGPTQFLPLHPLITVQNKSDLNITNHETSESSDYDALRQRFSVTSHPYLPVILCSDGYCLTVLKIPSDNYTLPRLVHRLINTGRSILGLSEIIPPTDKQTYDIQVDISKGKHTICEESLNTVSGLNSTLMNTSSATTDDSRKVCFAGVYDDHNLSTFDALSTSEKEYLARIHFQAAWGLILSASIYETGNGIYPNYLTSQKVRSLSLEMKIAQNVAVTTLATSTFSIEQHKDILSTLSLSFLDKFDQSCQKAVYKLANAYLISLLSKLMQEHKVFLSSSTHTVLSIETYAKLIASSLKLFWKMYQKVVVLAEELYTISTSESQKIFSVPLLLLRRISCIASHDLLSCNRLAMSMLPSELDSRNLQGREAGVLQSSVARRISEASAVLDNIRSIMVPYNINSTVVLTHCEHPCHNSDKEQSTNLLSIPHLLQTCQLQKTFELVYSIIAQNPDGIDDGPTCNISIPGINLVSPSVLAELFVSHPCLTFMLHLLARFMDAFLSSKTAGTVSCIIPPIPNVPSLKNQLSLSRQCLEVAHKSLTQSLGKPSLTKQCTPTHTVELYLLSGEWYEASKFAAKKGNWQQGLILGILHILMHETLQLEGSTQSFVKLKQFSHRLALKKIIRALNLSKSKLEIRQSTEQQPLYNIPDIAKILNVCGYGRLDHVGSEVYFLILQKIWKLVHSLPVQVPRVHQLPATPLYNPWSPKNECGTAESGEKQSRFNISYFIQSYFTMMNASSSTSLCHGWYTTALIELHHHDSRIRYQSMPNKDGSLQRMKIPATFKAISDANTSNVPVQELTCNAKYQLALFREMCGLLWLLHVRDNASHYLRKVFPSEQNDKIDVQTVSECALWCARLIPLCDCFDLKESSNIEDMLLSVISELPCNNLMVTLLAQNFPDDQQFGSKKWKLDRLMTKMRTTIVDKQNGEPQPLSVEYQIMCKAILEKRICNNFRPQCFQSDSDTHRLTLDEEGLTVGSHIFEYDQAYIDFLDNLFSTTITKPKTSLTQSLLKSHHPFHDFSFTTLSKSTIVSPPSANLSSQSKCSLSSLQPVVTYLYEWSQSASRTASSGHKRKNDDATAMRVELSLSFLMYCLHLEEEKHQRHISTHASSLETITEAERSSSMTNITPVLDDTSTILDDISTITTITPILDHISTVTSVTDDTSTITTVTAQLDDIPTPVFESTMTTVTPDIDSTTLSQSTLCAEDLGYPDADRPCNSLPLLQMPSNLFTEEDGYEQLTTTSSELSLTLTPDSTSDVTATDTGTCMNQEEVSTGQVLSGLDIDLTESQSIGELPSQLTFSVGEVGSCTNAVGATGLMSDVPQIITGKSDVEADDTLQVPHMEEQSSSLDDLHAIPDLASNEQTSFNLEKAATDSPQLCLEHSPSTLETTLPSLEIFQTHAEDTLSSSQLKTKLPATSIDESLKAPSHSSNSEPENDSTLTALGIRPDFDSTAPGTLGTNEEEEIDGKEIHRISDEKGESGRNRNLCVDLQDQEVIDDACEVVNERRQDDGDVNAVCNDQTNEHHLETVPSPQPTPVSQGTLTSKELGQQKTDISRIVRSEIKKLFQTQHKKIMDMLDTSHTTMESPQDLATTIPSSVHPTPVQSQVYDNTCSTSEQDEQSTSLSNTSHLSLKHLKQNTSPESPLPLLRLPYHFTPTQYHSTLHTITENPTIRDVSSKHASHKLPLLQLNNDVNTSQNNNLDLMESGLKQLPIVSSRVPGFPLLVLNEPIHEQTLPTIPDVSSTNPTHINLPLLQCSHPDPNPVTSFNFMPPLPTIRPTTIAPSMPSKSLPLLVPDKQNPPSLPSLIPIIPPVDALLRNNPMLSLPHMDHHNTSDPSNELDKNEVAIQTEQQPITTQNPTIVNTVTETTTIQAKEKSHVNTQPSIDNSQFQPRAMEGDTHQTTQEDDTQKSLYHVKRTTTDTSTQYSPTHMEHTTHITPLSFTHEKPKTRQTNNIEQLSNEHSEDVPELEDTNNQQTTNTTTTNIIPSSESEGCLVDLPSGQTDSNFMKTAIPSVHTQRKFIRVIDINTDEMGISISSSDEESSSADNELSQIQILKETKKEKGELSGEETVVEVVSEVGDIEGIVNVGESEFVSVGGDFSEGSKVGKVERSTDKAQHYSAEPQLCEESNDLELGHVSNEEDDGRGIEVKDMAQLHVLSQLRHLEYQLNTIENTARTVQGELLTSNQLLGTIDELQSVGQTSVTVPCPTSSSTTAHQTPTSKHTSSRMTVVAQTNDSSTFNKVRARIQTNDITGAVRSNGATHISARLPSPTTTTAKLPPHSTALSSLAHHVVTSYVPATIPPSKHHRKGSGTQQKVKKRQQQFGNERSSMMLSTRMSKQTLRKLVTATRKEKCPSSRETKHQMVLESTANPRRTQKEDHMNKRMNEALTLMEDILSAEPLSPSQLKFHHQHTNVHETSKKYTNTQCHQHSKHTATRTALGDTSSSANILITTKRTVKSSGDTGTSYCSSIKGFTAQEQLKMANIMASTELSNMSSGSSSIASHIDWELIDQLIDN